MSDPPLSESESESEPEPIEEPCQSKRPGGALTYRATGVDVPLAAALAGAFRAGARTTHGPQVVSHASGASLFRGSFSGIEQPLLASTCDGVGTKLLVARAAGRYRGLGQDLVAMNVNDLLVLGARPLFFLQYLAAGSLEGSALAEVVEGVVAACASVECALLGGETAEMPGVYAPGDFDLAGFAVGVVDEARVPNPTTIAIGDVVLGLPATGLHANGFSLARAALFGRAGYALDARPALLCRSLADELLAPTALYVDPVLALMRNHLVRAAAHVTGGGLRMRAASLLRPGLRLRFDTGAWPRPAIFDVIQRAGAISEAEMQTTFNLGLGFIVVVSPAVAEAWLAREGAARWGWRAVGSIEPGEGVAFDR